LFYLFVTKNDLPGFTGRLIIKEFFFLFQFYGIFFKQICKILMLGLK